MKNYVVIADNLEHDEISFMVHYLIDNNHKNHKEKTEKIIRVSKLSSKDFLKLNGDKINRNLNLKKRGAKMKVSNKSITFDLPKDYEVSEDQVVRIANDIENEIIDLYKDHGHEITHEELFSVVHLQDNSHIHTIVPILNNETSLTMRFTKSKEFISHLKTIMTKCVDNVLETNINDYKTQSEATEDISNIGKLSLEEILELKEKHKHQKLLKRAYDYAYRIRSKELENEDTTKQSELLENTLIKIVGNDKISEQEQIILSGMLERLNIDNVQPIQSLTRRLKEQKEKTIAFKEWGEDQERKKNRWIKWGNEQEEEVKRKQKMIDDLKKNKNQLSK